MVAPATIDDDNVLDFVQDSLVRRMRTMSTLSYDVVETMSLEQVNHVDQPGRLPIAFSLFPGPTSAPVQ